MRIDRVVRDVLQSLRQVLNALDNKITARDNLAPTGQTGVRVLTSLDPNAIPTWELISGGSEGSGEPGIPGIQGPPGTPGTPGADGTCIEDCSDMNGFWEPLVGVEDPGDEPELVFAYTELGVPDLVMAWRTL